MSDTPQSGAPRPQDGEHKEPGDMVGRQSGGLESPPMWMWLLIFVVLFTGVYFLGANLGNIGADPWPQGGGDTPAVTIAETPAIDGGAIYDIRCVTCHQAGGAGIQGIFPPLANSEWVADNPDNVVRIVLQGLQGPIEVAGVSYNSVMPGLASQMPDDEIAAVITHVRTSFGNSASAVSAADVSRIRSETQGRSLPWTADELSGMPAATTTPAVSTPTPTPAPVVAQAAPAASPAGGGGGSGAELFAQFACNTCHSVDAPTAMVGPSLFDVGNRMTKGEIYEAIVDPDATIAEGYAAGLMSAMVGTMNFSTAELNRLVDYLASLKG